LRADVFLWTFRNNRKKRYRASFFLDEKNNQNLTFQQVLNSSLVFTALVNWKTLSPLTLSEICIALAYILIHLRMMEILRVQRKFGPLQVSYLITVLLLILSSNDSKQYFYRRHYWKRNI